MKVLGIVPARGGSKRLPRKHLLPLQGKPLIAYTIEAALQAKGIDRLIVSTDDSEIASVAVECGAEVPFLRPAELAADATPDQPVLVHALEWLRENENYVPEIVLNLRPTTPLKTPRIIEEVIRRILETGADVVRTLAPVEGVHHPYWMYKVSKDGRAETFIEGLHVSRYYQSQLLPPVYRIAAVVIMPE